jgi:hypothetical protein
MKGIKATILAVLPVAAFATASSGAVAADVTCISTRTSGVLCLDADGKWAAFNRKTGHFKSRRVRDMAVCRGRIFVADRRAVRSFDGKKWSDPNAMPRGYARRIACTPNGYIVASSRMIAWWNGSGWRIWDAKAVLKDQKRKYFRDATVDKDGNVWFVAAGGVVGRISGDSVKIWKEGQGFERRRSFSRILAAADGNIYVPYYRGLYTPDGDTWKLIAGSGARRITQTPDGALWLVRGKRLNRFENNSWKTLRIDHSARDVAVDAADRIWVATEYGLAVGKDGDWQWRQMHNSDLTDNSLYQVAVLGKGGALPDKKDQPPGSLKGRLEWRDTGEPVKNVAVQICGISRGLFSKSPCAGQPHAQATKTDSEGRFSFKQAAPASYRFVIKLGEKWVRSLLSYRRAHVLPGKARNTGTVRISKRYRKYLK